MSDGHDSGDAGLASSGVEALIQRLRDEGVVRGRKRAEELVQDAESRARWLVEQAQAEAEQIRAAAHREADALRRSGEEALEVAARDTVLEVHGALVARFRGQVQQLVANELDKEAFLQQLILALAGRLREQEDLDADGELEVILPESAVGLEELRRKPEALREGTLSYFVVAVAEEMLRAGVSITFSGEHASGLRLRLHDEGVDIDLTEESIADLLIKHLQPRFRALLEGVLR